MVCSAVRTRQGRQRSPDVVFSCFSKTLISLPLRSHFAAAPAKKDGSLHSACYACCACYACHTPAHQVACLASFPTNPSSGCASGSGSGSYPRLAFPAFPLAVCHGVSLPVVLVLLFVLVLVLRPDTKPVQVLYLLSPPSHPFSIARYIQVVPSPSPTTTTTITAIAHHPLTIRFG